MDLIEKVKDAVTEKLTNMPTPEGSITDVDLKGIGRDCITYQAYVAVKNPYSVPIPICEISYILKSSGRVIATGTVPDPGSLKGQDTTNLEVPVKVPHSVMASLVKDIATDWDIDYELELGFIVDLPVFGNFTFPLTRKARSSYQPSLTCGAAVAAARKTSSLISHRSSKHKHHTVNYYLESLCLVLTRLVGWFVCLIDV